MFEMESEMEQDFSLFSWSLNLLESNQYIKQSHIETKIKRAIKERNQSNITKLKPKVQTERGKTNNQ